VHSKYLSAAKQNRLPIGFARCQDFKAVKAIARTPVQDERPITRLIIKCFSGKTTFTGPQGKASLSGRRIISVRPMCSEAYQALLMDCAMALLHYRIDRHLLNGNAQPLQSHAQPGRPSLMNCVDFFAALGASLPPQEAPSLPLAAIEAATLFRPKSSNVFRVGQPCSLSQPSRA